MLNATRISSWSRRYTTADGPIKSHNDAMLIIPPVSKLIVDSSAMRMRACVYNEGSNISEIQLHNPAGTDSRISTDSV